ncbi:NAD-dependent epimerase/dehydratase family protein [Bradyrhizobium elkanii]|uniref:NAD-dependent epimerase/dehydratase family protein n=1 Tax=Bradyrhizobium elkanii TaxID=29448 RepID=UPI0003F8E027|nr:NAD(P)-dependent oxidoreductase [Bradyrhizobium elkanii]
MTILITGATGLVGERLVPRLVAAGEACRVLLRGDARAADGVSAVNGDLLDRTSLAKAVDGVSAILHLAATFRTPDTDLIWRVNLEGTQNLIAAAKTYAPGARFIMASTGHVYGTDTPHPGREDDVSNPQHAYPASKLAAEKALQESGLNWTIQRFAFVYGDGDGHLEALPKHAADASFHPAMRMSMVHHRDIATAMKLALTGAMDRRVVNIADDAPTSLYELAGLVNAPISGSAEALATPWRLHMDTTLARQLGFQASIRTVHQALAEKLL